MNFAIGYKLLTYPSILVEKPLFEHDDKLHSEEAGSTFFSCALVVGCFV